jgi:hypothetical protein
MLDVAELESVRVGNEGADEAISSSMSSLPRDESTLGLLLALYAPADADELERERSVDWDLLRV